MLQRRSTSSAAPDLQPLLGKRRRTSDAHSTPTDESIRQSNNYLSQVSGFAKFHDRWSHIGSAVAAAAVTTTSPRTCDSGLEPVSNIPDDCTPTSVSTATSLCSPTSSVSVGVAQGSATPDESIVATTSRCHSLGQPVVEDVPQDRPVTVDITGRLYTDHGPARQGSNHPATTSTYWSSVPHAIATSPTSATHSHNDEAAAAAAPNLLVTNVPPALPHTLAKAAPGTLSRLPPPSLTSSSLSTRPMLPVAEGSATIAGPSAQQPSTHPSRRRSGDKRTPSFPPVHSGSNSSAVSLAPAIRPSEQSRAAPLADQPKRKIPFDARLMLVSIDQKMKEIQKLPNPIEQFRLQRLRQAVLADDWFFLVLAQLYIIRDLSPTSLPLPVLQLASETFGPIEFILSSNSNVSVLLLHWLSTFPAPIMQFYSSDNLRGLYTKEVDSVVELMTTLHGHWKVIHNNVTRLKTTPLVEELTESLNLTSPVFQQTMSRSLLSLMFGPDRLGAQGSRQFIQIQARNEHNFARGFSLRKDLRQHAYWAMGKVYREWHEYARRVHLFASQHPDLDIGTAEIMPQKTSSLDEMLKILDKAIPPAARSTLVVRKQLFPRQSDPPKPVPARPDTTSIALHQAHLRSPTLKLADECGTFTPLYRVITGFAHPPTMMTMRTRQEICFSLSTEHLANVSGREAAPRSDEPKIRRIRPGSIMYRLRCVRIPSAGIQDESEWVTSPCTWPHDLYLSLNGTALEIRRKLHHARNLAIDVTDILQQGDNELTIHLNQISSRDEGPTQNKSELNYMAIERVEVFSYEQILQKIPLITPETNLTPEVSGITQSKDRSATSHNSDSVDVVMADDLAVLTSSTSITLCDPILGAEICKIPVRGKSCLHPNCFDLDTFLTSLPRDATGIATAPDAWTCPICRGDVRPQLMIRDGFLDQVRDTLLARGQADARTIILDSDGQWRVKEEKRTGQRSPSLDRPDIERRLSSPVKATPPTVIILDDDD